MKSIWAISMVKDEQDIIGFTLAQLEAQGVNGIIVADNNSSDRTWEQLQAYKEWSQIPVLLLKDPVVAYYQSKKMTGLATLAHQQGAEWVVPFDADELWYGIDNRTIRYHLEKAAVSIVHVPQHLHIPHEMDWSTGNPFHDMEHRHLNPSPLSKVAVRFNSDIILEQGNHKAHGTAEYPGGIFAGLAIRHFPVRNFEQYKSKVINHGVAYDFEDIPLEYAHHLRIPYREFLCHGEVALRNEYGMLLAEPRVCDPAPYVGRWEQ